MTFQRGRYNGGGWPKGVRRHGAGSKRAIAILRREHRSGSSYRWLARMIGVDPHTVIKWISGRNYPSPTATAKIMRMLGES